MSEAATLLPFLTPTTADRPVSELPAEEAAALGRLLARLLAGGDCTLVVSVGRADADFNEGLYWSVSLRAPGRSTVHSCRSSLTTALELAAGGEETRLCRGCSCRLPRSMFGRDAAAADGLLRRCRPCERARIAAWEAKRQAASGGERRRTRG